ncbi:hypothetical protein K469DRAFT_222467 [Zopfia rhizophila CBS 207.26]|uniref:Uncharacterized protein n=1 Tax=Zopfia rhizophila CBS 207.26 TaxID=1314779 RepID=A0A6A6DWX7_9PEZI|nr:hypothetical protein K469DRAFT_222467 [Zopfia rhizophila CBS 207.26]
MTASQLSQNKVQSTQNELPPFPTARVSISPKRVGGSTELGELAKLIANLQEAIVQQSSIIASQNSIIKSVRTDLAVIKAEQQYFKNQNAELQETISSLRAQLDTLSVSPPSTRSRPAVARRDQGLSREQRAARR